jgi:hypothetical protein
MNCESFFTGIGVLAAAYLFRKLDKWAYGNPKSTEDIYGYGKIVTGWMWIVFLIIVGIGYIISSLPAKI